jgi:hypothetical protein
VYSGFGRVCQRCLPQHAQTSFTLPLARTCSLLAGLEI